MVATSVVDVKMDAPMSVKAVATAGTDAAPSLVINNLSYAYPMGEKIINCLLYTSPSPRDRTRSRMPSSA